MPAAASQVSCKAHTQPCWVSDWGSTAPFFGSLCPQELSHMCSPWDPRHFVCSTLFETLCFCLYLSPNEGLKKLYCASFPYTSHIVGSLQSSTMPTHLWEDINHLTGILGTKLQAELSIGVSRVLCPIKCGLDTHIWLIYP